MSLCYLSLYCCRMWVCSLRKLNTVLFWKKKRFLIAPPSINLPCIKRDRKIGKFLVAQHTHGIILLLHRNGLVQLYQLWWRTLSTGEPLSSQPGFRTDDLWSQGWAASLEVHKTLIIFTPGGLDPEFLRRVAPQWSLPDNVALRASFLRTGLQHFVADWT